MKPETLSCALSAVADIAEYSNRGDVVMAAQARRTLNDLACSWQDDIGGLGYPTVIRDALRKAGLRESP